MAICKACQKEVDTAKPDGWNGKHRYGCIGPSTWSGLLEGYGHYQCWCGEAAVIEIHRGLMVFYACSPKHARRKTSESGAKPSPFAPFVLACYPKLPNDW